MRTSRSALPSVSIAVLVLLASIADPRPLAGEEQGSDVTRQPTPHLGLGAPPDCVLYVRGVRSPSWRAVGDRFGGLIDALGDARLPERVVHSLLAPPADAGEAGEEQLRELRERARGEARAWLAVIGTIEWRTLLDREFVIALRSQFPRIDVLALFRVEPDARPRLSRQLTGLLEEIAARGDDLEMVQTVREGIPTVVVQSARDADAQICLGGSPDVLAVSTSTKLMRHSLNLLASKGVGNGLVIDEAYDELIATLPPPAVKGTEFLEALVRPGIHFEQVDALLRFVTSSEDVSDARFAEVFGVAVDRLRSFRDSFDVVEGAAFRVAATEDGGELVGRLAVTLRENHAERELGKVFHGRPLDPVDRLVPAEAESFLAFSGLDVSALLSRGPRLIESGVIQREALAAWWKTFGERLDESGRRALVAKLRGDVVLLATGSGDAALLASLSDAKEAAPIAAAQKTGDDLSLAVEDDQLVLHARATELARSAVARRRGEGAAGVDPRAAARWLDVPGDRGLVMDLDARTLERWATLVAALVGSQPDTGEQPRSAAGDIMKLLGELERIRAAVARQGTVLRGRVEMTARRGRKSF